MISIVIPVYNVAEHISSMLDSIIQQSYKEIEVILVNDGSADNTSAICHEYADRYCYITVYDRENHGPAASRNFGLEKAQGEFIWFMDSDDILEKDALYIATEAQKKHDADMVVGGMNFCFTAENRVVPKKVRNEIIFSKQEFKNYYRELFSLNYISPLWNKLIRRSVLIENNIKMHNSLRTYEDYVFCMDTVFNCKKVVCLTDVFYNYQLRDTESLSRRYKQNAIEMFYILQNKIEEYREAFGYEVDSADNALNNLAIYLSYECVKNEARHMQSYKKVKSILNNEKFHSILLKYKGFGRKYHFVHIIMKKKLSLVLLLYFKISGKVN